MISFPKNIASIFILGIITINIYSLEPIRIGSSAVLTGHSKDLGIEYTQGAMMVFNKVNREGGIKNRLIEYRVYDDTYNPEPCLENTIKLIEFDKVDFLFNYVGTPTTTAILPLLKINEDKNVILFGNLSGAGAQRTDPYSKFVYNVRPSYSEETAALVTYFHNRGLKKIGIVYQIDGYGRSGYSGVKNKLQKFNSDIVAEATYNRGQSFSSSMKAQVNHLKTKDIEVVISVGSYEASAAFIRDARESGLNVPIANISFVGTESLLNILKSHNISLKNLYFSEVVPSYSDAKYPIIKEYLDSVERLSMAPNFIALEGYINAKLLTSILKTTTLNISRENMRSIIDNMPPIDIGLNTPLQFKRGNNQILDRVYLYTLNSVGTLIEVDDD